MFRYAKKETKNCIFEHSFQLEYFIMKIRIKDESISGNTNNSFSIEVDSDTISVGEIIKNRIFEEVKKYNQRMPEFFNSLVQPTNTEKELNGFKFKVKRQIDPEKQYYLALDAFQKNGFFMIINGEQVDELEEQVAVIDNMEVSFIKLTPLVGG